VPCTSQSSSQIATVLSSEPPTERPSTQAFLRHREGPHFSLLGNNRYPTDLLPIGDYLIERLPQNTSVPSCVEVKGNSLAAARRLQTLVAHTPDDSFPATATVMANGTANESVLLAQYPIHYIALKCGQPASRQPANTGQAACRPETGASARAIPCLFMHFY